MTHDLHGISRRSVLAALGAVGVTATGAGYGTYAYLSDRERVDGTLAAGSVELKADYRAVRDGAGTPVRVVPDPYPQADGEGDPDCSTRDLIDGGLLPTATFESVVPGQGGTLSSCVYVCENPTYVWVRACVDDDTEVGGDPTRREVAAGDTDGDGELAEAIQATLYLDENGDGVRDDGEPVVFEGSLAALDAFACAGVPLGPSSVGGLTNDGPAGYEGTSVPDLDPDDCVPLGKVEEPDPRPEAGGSVVFVDGESGDETQFGPSTFTGAEYDAAVDRYVFTTADGGTVLVSLSDPAYNGDDELVAVTVTFDSPGVGFCRTIVKSGGSGRQEDPENDPNDGVVDVSYDDCPRAVRLRSPSPTVDTPLADAQEISHLTLFACGRDTEREPPEPVCYEPGRYCLGVEWELPLDTGVEASTDTVTLDLAVAGTQCRHEMDPGARNPFDRLGATEGGVSP
jgi:predicted ribosomally synthesized peptide with SipW-like signal peptide